MKSYILILATILLFGTSVFFRKLAVDKISPYQLQLISCIIYSLSIPFWIYFLKKDNIVINYDAHGIIFAVCCVVTNVIGAVIFGKLLKSSNATGGLTVAISINPIVTYMLSIMFLSEEITTKKIIACIFAFLGLLIFNL
jgi:uncharacterized membrane protein